VAARISDAEQMVETKRSDLLMNMPAWRKLELLCQLNATAKLLALAGLQSRYPKADKSELNRRLAILLLGENLAQKIFGPFDEGKGEQ